MRALSWLLIAAFTAILLLPLAQMRFHFLHETELRGVTLETRRPSWAFAGWWSGTFQKDFEAWFDENLGFRGYFIKIDNQIGYSVFHDASSKAVDRPVLGLKGMLYEEAYVQALNGSAIPAEADLAALAARLRRLEDAFAARDIPFVFVVSPSKAALYPEYVRPEFLLPKARRLPTTYERFVRELQREGVRYVDGHAILAREKARGAPLLYPPGGIHWSTYGAHFVVRAIWSEFEKQLARPLVMLRCDSLSLDARPLPGGVEPDETDMERLLNAVKIDHGGWKYAHPTLVSDSTANTFRPRLLLVGDSFGWQLTRILARQEMVATIDYYYYFKKHWRITSPSPKPAAMPPRRVDWDKDVFSADAILLEVNEIQIDSTGCGFVDQALARLANDPGAARVRR